MLKRAFSVVLQILLLLAVFLLGSLATALNVIPSWQIQLTSTRVFVYDGVVLMLLLYALIIAVEAARKRLSVSAPTTTLALILALAFGLAMKFGFRSL